MNVKKIVATIAGLAVAGAGLVACDTTKNGDAEYQRPEHQESVQEWEVDTASDTPFYTAEVIGKNSPKYIEVIYDESQKTHWENGGLVIGTYGHALAACQDGRFLPKSDQRDCIYGASQWAKDTHQKMAKVGPITLPKQPAKKAPVKKAPANKVMAKKVQHA